MKALVKSAWCLMVLALAQPAAAETAWFYYTDGTVLAREIELQPLPPAAPRDDRGPQGVPVTLNTQVILQDREGLNEPFFVARRETVFILTSFTPLNEVEVPFEELLGQTLTILLVAPSVGIGEGALFTLFEGDAELSAIGRIVDIPADAPFGPFPLTSVLRITEQEVVDAEDSIVRAVRPGPPPATSPRSVSDSGGSANAGRAIYQ